MGFTKHIVELVRLRVVGRLSTSLFIIKRRKEFGKVLVLLRDNNGVYRATV